jgi:folate-dependent phosphoribosylglycinamide formyltransferase PurN
MKTQLPRAVLIYHQEDRIDAEGLSAWVSKSFDLVGIIALRELRVRKLRRALNEVRRSGILGFMDVLAFRLYYRLFLARADAAWIAAQVSSLRARYPATLDRVPRLTAASPNTGDVQGFLSDLKPDLMIARCKFILRPDIFNTPSAGTFVLHPGICPEYRNAHGCFWALVNRDLARVGMTLLRVDSGIDTGPILFQGTYPYDEVRESHIVIQYRVVLENLEEIRETLMAVWRGRRTPVARSDRRSMVWGQPRLSAYLRWRQAASGHSQ